MLHLQLQHPIQQLPIQLFLLPIQHLPLLMHQLLRLELPQLPEQLHPLQQPQLHALFAQYLELDAPHTKHLQQYTHPH